MRNKSQKGFTLVELLIVLVIISIIAAISTVSALSMRLNANEGLAKSSLKTIASACESYASANTLYPSTLRALGIDYLPSDLVDGQKSGYKFVLASGNGGYTFTAYANPVSRNFSGVKSYCITNMNAISVYNTGNDIAADGIICPTGGSTLN